MRNPMWLHQETDPPASGGGEGKDDRPEWLPQQFETPEALAKSYDESRREMDRLRTQLDEERAGFSATLEQITSAQPPAPQPGFDPQTNPLLTAAQQALEAGDAGALLSINLALAQQATAQVIDQKLGELGPRLDTQSQADRDMAFQLAQDRVARGYGDKWADIAPEVNTWLHEHAGWLPQVNSPDAFEQIIREGASAVEGKRAAEQLAQLQAARDARLSAQTATGGASSRHPTVTDEKKQAWKEVQEASVTSYSDIARG